MKKILLFITSIFFIFSATFAQQNIQYSKAKIWLLNKDVNELQALGLATDHGSYKTDTWFITDLSETEIQVIENAGFNVEILIENVQEFYVERNQEGIQKKDKALGCGATSFSIPTVQNYSNGSMGGFFTYQEMLNNLDSMQSMYPNLITAKAPISSFTSIENRPIYWLRISNNPNTDDLTKPEIMYSALHHAREPASMQQLIYYMWYVLENYASNPELKYLVDNVEMYFVPCINPDGYVYNVTNNPNGGGMHRKNRRDVGNNNKGVDLNRNYAYEYGGVGSSNNVNNDTYRGTGAFSEPETQAMKWLTENHDFQIALNYHSYADALLFPWGYTDNMECADHDLYTALSNFMVSDNNYDNYQSSLLYEAAGDSDDWGYGEQVSKPKVFSMTPEVGSDNDGFWPNQNNIVEICRENVFQNYAAAISLLDNYELTDLSSGIIPNPNFSLDLNLQRLGLQATNYTLTLTATNATISNVNNPQVLTGLDFGDNSSVVFTGTIDPASVTNGEIEFVVSVATNNYTFYDTIVKFFGTTISVFESNASDLNNWDSTDDWDLDNDAYSAPTSISDSPNGAYGNGENNELISSTINLTAANIAVAEFYAKWDIEQGYDYVQISAQIVDQNTWVPLCGSYTVLGNDNQDENEPLYDGEQSTWVKESLDLTAFIGENIQLRFRLVSDNFSTGEGFKFDDFKVLAIGDSIVSSIQTLTNLNFQIAPNPTEGSLKITLKDLSEELTLSIENVLGQEVLRTEINTLTTNLDLSILDSGNYFVVLRNKEGRVGMKKIVVL